MKKFDEFSRSIIKSDYGLSVKDVMETDWRDLMAVIGHDEEENEVQDDIMPLGDFVRQMQGT